MTSSQQIYNTYKKTATTTQHTLLLSAVQLVKNIIHKNNNKYYTCQYCRIDGMYVSFNGGKDATVTVFIMYFAMMELGIDGRKIECLYFQEPNPFVETIQFMSEIQKMLPITIHRLPSKSYPSELTQFHHTHPFSHILMGTRKNDPGSSHLQPISPSDTEKGYPKFDRILPLIEWSCAYVWKVIKQLQIPYCILYEKGYTSVGNMSNTKKNQKLEMGAGKWGYAWELDDEDERVNRVK